MRHFHREGEGPAQDEIFVFGSNLKGVHGRGAALAARRHYGAIIGQGVGLQGRSYAIPTKGAVLEVLSLQVIEQHVDEFIVFATRHPELKFYVTAVGCGLAGYKSDQIAPMFEKCPLNCRFSMSWYVYV